VGAGGADTPAQRQCLQGATIPDIPGVGLKVAPLAAVCESISYEYPIFGFRIGFQNCFLYGYGRLVGCCYSFFNQIPNLTQKYDTYDKILKPNSESGNGIFVRNTFAKCCQGRHFWVVQVVQKLILFRDTYSTGSAVVPLVSVEPSPNTSTVPYE